MAVGVTQVTAVVAAVALTAAHLVSLMAIALRVLMVTLLPVLMPIHAPKRHQALTQAARSNPHVHPMVVTMAATTMIALHGLAVTLVITLAATLVVAKNVVQRLLIVVVRIRVSVHHVLMRIHAPKRLLAPKRGRVPTRAVKSVVHLAVTAHTSALLPVMATAMIARRVLSATVIHVRSLIAHHAPILSVRIANNVRSVLQRRAANTHHVHAPSARSHSSAQNARNTRHVQRVRSSMKLVRRVTRSVLLVLPQRPLPTVAIARLAVLPSRLSMLRR